MKLRDHTFLGMTQSLCPECLDVIPAKIIVRGGRVYFRKRCSRHGVREDYVCGDVRWFDRNQYATPGKLPPHFGTEAARGCPYDCGLCEEHEQHTCIALLEITSNCNLRCPMCFAGSGPGGVDMSFETARDCIDRLVHLEGRAEVLQISGGEPTIHPRFDDILAYACDSPIDVVMVNTNGLAIARDDRLIERLSRHRGRAEVYLQFDGLCESNYERLRGADLLQTKLNAIERLGLADIPTTLVATLTAGINEDQVGSIIRFATDRPHVTGVSFQPATYCGRHFLPHELHHRVTFPDVIAAISEQAGETLSEDDFFPLPCAHPNAHALTYLVRDDQHAIPLTRLIDIEANMDLLANGIVFTKERARQLFDRFVQRSAARSGRKGSGQTGPGQTGSGQVDPLTREISQRFFESAGEMRLRQSDFLRITITSFMDAYNFDIRQLMKSCVHHITETGHLIPFSAYNVLYRDGHLPLTKLSDRSTLPKSASASASMLPVLNR